MQASKPVMGVVQDALVGSRLFTERDNFLNKVDVMHLLMWMPSWDGVMPEPAILKPEPLWTGKQLFTMLLPDVELVRNNAWHQDSAEETAAAADTKVIIHRGELLTGILCKKTLGTSSGGLVHIIFMQHGADRAAEFLSHVQYVINHWLEIRGFSVGIGDMHIDEQTQHKINSTLGDAMMKVNDLVKSLHRGEINNIPGQTQRATFEMKVNQMLNAARDDGKHCFYQESSLSRAIL